eukprot:s383_g25.t1
MLQDCSAKSTFMLKHQAWPGLQAASLGTHPVLKPGLQKQIPNHTTQLAEFGRKAHSHAMAPCLCPWAANEAPTECGICPSAHTVAIRHAGIRFSTAEHDGVLLVIASGDVVLFNIRA